MKKMQQPLPTYSTDANGKKLAHVALANTSERTTMYAEDYKRIITQGFSRFWSYTSTGGKHRYVLCAAGSTKGGARSLTIARLATQAAKNQRVEYIDGNRLNLRTENLRLVKGHTKVAANWVSPRPASTTDSNRPPVPTTT